MNPGQHVYIKIVAMATDMAIPVVNQLQICWRLSYLENVCMGFDCLIPHCLI